MSAIFVVCCTAPDSGVADKIANTLVEERLAACAQFSKSPIESVYRWKGKVEKAEEIQLWFKTKEECVQRIISRIQELHPYDVPEIIVLPIQSGLPDYLSWVEAETI